MCSLQRIQNFAYKDILDGFVEGITRRDPSPVIQVGETYYVWYSRSTVTHHGYTATIWYAASRDGHCWAEQGQGGTGTGVGPGHCRGL